MAEQPIDATLFQAADEQHELRELSRDVDYKIPGVRLEALMGAGTFGEVWSGTQERTGQKVAVKIFTRPFGLDWEYFRQEIERLRDVAEHPNIVTLLDADLNHEPAYLVMPLLTGGSLGDKNPEERTPELVVSWFYQIAEALNFIHQKGMLHCDLKPVNVLLDGEGRARLVDFGQSLQAGGSQSSLGTVGYMAPEQAGAALGQVETGPNSSWDIYSLGATIYSLLTGQLPRIPLASRNQLSHLTDAGERLAFYTDTLMNSPLVGVRELNPAVPAELAAIIEACLALDPQQRPASAGEVMEDLRRWEQRQPLLVKKPWTTAYQLNLFLRRHTATVAISTVFLVVLLGLTMLTTQSLKSKVEERSGQEEASAPAEVVPTPQPVQADATQRLRAYLEAAEIEARAGERQRQGLPALETPLGGLVRSQDEIEQVALSPREDWLGVRSADGRAQLLETGSWRQLELPGLACFAFAKESIALGYLDGRVEVRDGTASRPRLVGRHDGPVTSVHFRGARVVSSSLDGTVRDFANPPRAFGSPVLAAATTSKGLLLAATADGRLFAGDDSRPCPGPLVSLWPGGGRLLDGRRITIEGNRLTVVEATPVATAGFILPPGEPARELVEGKNLWLVVGRRSVRCYLRQARPEPTVDRDLPANLVRMRAELESGTRLAADGKVSALTAREWTSLQQAYRQLRTEHSLRCAYKAAW
ncbi:MAG: WD40 repeat domain-containing serine/threonine protein kinase [Vulcanimicrobiota bacterium]